MSDRDLHPLTQVIWDKIQRPRDPVTLEELDETLRSYGSYNIRLVKVAADLEEVWHDGDLDNKSRLLEIASRACRLLRNIREGS